MSIFKSENDIPLAKRRSPKNFKEYEGQEHLVSLNKAIYMMGQQKQVQSMIFYGPPASGKTGLAKLLATTIDAEFISVNALLLSSDDIKKIHITAIANHTQNLKTVLFIDEIHRLTKPKQDAFLASVEEGLIILIGATTENPYFVLQPALRSRLLIFEFFPLTKNHLKNILHRALEEDYLLKELSVKISSEAEEFLLQNSSDPRNMFIILETTILTKSGADYILQKEDFQNILQKSDNNYDSENQHYDIISAFIKSIRGSDPDAALYYLAMMIEGGEDPRFIFRRLLISAVEDIGLAYPEAINIVLSCADAFEKIGFPEGQLLLSHATLLLAGLPKSNSVLSVHDAIAYIKDGNILPVPKHLRDTHYQGAEDLGHGLEYKYPHDYPDNFIQQQYINQPVSFYKAQNIGFEKKIKDRLERLWQKKF